MSRPNYQSRIRSMNVTPAEESELLDQVNTDVLEFMRDFLFEYGQIFGSRIYDEGKVTERESLCNKIMMGLFGPRHNNKPDIAPFQKPETPFENDDERTKAVKEHEKRETGRINSENKQKKEDDKNFKTSEKVLDTILKERTAGLSTVYMNYVLVLYVKADRKSTTKEVGAVRMFRFSKTDAFERPSNNLFIGSDTRLYQNWADFMGHNKIPHNCLVLAPSGGQFEYRDGNLLIDIFHAKKYFRTYADPVLTGVGLLGTGLLVATLPPVGVAVGVGAAGVGAVHGITRGIMDLFDRRKHNTLMCTSTILPTIDILSNVLFAHSAVVALRMSQVSTFISSEKFLASLLFTENALRIGAVSRLSLDILSTIIAFGIGELDWLTMSQRLTSSCIFLYNVGLAFTPAQFSHVLNSLPCALSNFLTYENIQPFIQLTERAITQMPGLHLTENTQEFTGLFSIVLHNVRNSNRLNFGNLTLTLKRLMNVKWDLITQDLIRCKKWADKCFNTNEYISDFKNIQLAVVYNVHETLQKFVEIDDANVVAVDFSINKLMQEVIELWKRLFCLIYPDQNPDIRHCTMVMRYLINKMDFLLRHNIDMNSQPSTANSPSRPKLLPITELYALIMEQLIGADIYEMSAECSEMIAKNELEPIQHVVQHRYATVSFVEQRSTNFATEEIFQDSNGIPSALYKVDPATKLGVLVKYALN